MKKYIILLAVLSVTALHSFAQLLKRDLPVIYLPADVSVHFVSPEPIRFVDISVKGISGDLPVPNVLRIRLRDSLARFSDAVVTITGQKFIAQYRIQPCSVDREGMVATEVAVNPGDMRPLDNLETGLTIPELRMNALRLLASKPGSPVTKQKDFGLTGAVFHVYTLADYIFLDVGYRNDTKLPFTIDQIRFSIEDKKVTKASTVQSVPITPVFVLQELNAFERHYRNIFVFKKLTYPGNKVFHIELSEKQQSGRFNVLQLNYKDLLGADVLPPH